MYVVAAPDFNITFGLYWFELSSGPPALFQTHRLPFTNAGDAFCLLNQPLEVASKLRWVHHNDPHGLGVVKPVHWCV